MTRESSELDESTEGTFGDPLRAEAPQALVNLSSLRLWCLAVRGKCWSGLACGSEPAQRLAPHLCMCDSVRAVPGRASAASLS